MERQDFTFEGNLRPEILREENPTRFIALFKELTGMLSQEELTNIGESEGRLRSRTQELARVIGAIVVGSSSDSSSHPKDIDVLLVVDRFPNHYSHDYSEELRTEFDMQFSLRNKVSDIERNIFPVIEHGRLDFLGFIPLEPSDFLPLFVDAIRRAPQDPPVFAFDKSTSIKISQTVSEIRRSK